MRWRQEGGRQQQQIQTGWKQMFPRVKRKTGKKKKVEMAWRRITTGRRERSRRSYLGRPWRRCWWRTWSWGWGWRRPRCGTWRASPRSGARGSPRCSGMSSGRASGPRRCHGGTAGWRTACTRTPPGPSATLWSCGPGDTWETGDLSWLGGGEGGKEQRRLATKAAEPEPTRWEINPLGSHTSLFLIPR